MKLYIAYPGNRYRVQKGNEGIEVVDPASSRCERVQTRLLRTGLAFSIPERLCRFEALSGDVHARSLRLARNTKTCLEGVPEATFVSDCETRTCTSIRRTTHLRRPEAGGIAFVRESRRSTCTNSAPRYSPPHPRTCSRQELSQYDHLEPRASRRSDITHLQWVTGKRYPQSFAVLTSGSKVVLVQKAVMRSWGSTWKCWHLFRVSCGAFQWRYEM